MRRSARIPRDRCYGNLNSTEIPGLPNAEVIQGEIDLVKLRNFFENILFLRVRWLRQSLLQQRRPHVTKGQLASRHVSSRTTSPSAADIAREEKAENERWAKQPGAREVLAQPLFEVDRKPDDANRMYHSLEDYLKVCGLCPCDSLLLLSSVCGHRPVLQKCMQWGMRCYGS